MFLGNRRPRVAHRDADLSIDLFDAHLDDLLGCGVLHGVVQQVDQGPAQLGLFDVRLGVATDLDAYLGVLEDVVQVIEGRRHFFGQ
ncbi:hypothetical protein D3C81_2130880 [compost metagenome]